MSNKSPDTCRPSPEKLLETGDRGLETIKIDFLNDELTYRRKFGGGKNQAIAKAVGLKSYKEINVLDATAGMGIDAFILSSLGAKVTMVERNQEIGNLLKEALEEVKGNEEIKDIISRLSLHIGDAIEFLDKSEEYYDIIYVDPMFPEKDKTALPKKEMQIFKEIVGKDEDAPALLQKALEKAKKRVVVKRPRLAEKIPGPEPSHVIEGKSNRFDVYMVSN